ncbi:MAG: metalloregulator ArsR/SmtB family transcription factor, partial [Nitrososphaerota archaeon]
ILFLTSYHIKFITIFKYCYILLYIMNQKIDINKFRAKIFKALSDPIRLEIINLLRKKEWCTCDLIPYLNIVQPLVSRHLKILKDCGLIIDRKEGNKRIYSITDKRILKVIDTLSPELIKSISKHIVKQII